MVTSSLKSYEEATLKYTQALKTNVPSIKEGKSPQQL